MDCSYHFVTWSDGRTETNVTAALSVTTNFSRTADFENLITPLSITSSTSWTELRSSTFMR
jgi:hypothetical protein